MATTKKDTFAVPRAQADALLRVQAKLKGALALIEQSEEPSDPHVSNAVMLIIDAMDTVCEVQNAPSH